MRFCALAPACAQTLGASAQNRVGELYSLVRFLRISPYAYYYCSSGRSKCAADILAV